MDLRRFTVTLFGDVYLSIELSKANLLILYFDSTVKSVLTEPDMITGKEVFSLTHFAYSNPVDITGSVGVEDIWHTLI